MQRKPPYCVITEETQDCSSQQIQRPQYINCIEQAKIIDVWADNFHLEMQRISVLSKKYNHISMDTQFPSTTEYNQKSSYLMNLEQEKYMKLVKNVDSTSLIQLGMCLSDQQGGVPSQSFCWQFNFKFQGDIDQISPSSGQLLKKAGINFQKLRQNGIGYKTFTHQFIKSGLLLNKHNKWIVFHGGFDFSYLLKLIKNECLPRSIQDFYKSIKIYFPQKIDIKNIIQKDKRFRTYGLSKLSDSILCRRIGPEHQAGSDALLTMRCYFKLRNEFENLFQNLGDVQQCIYGIGSCYYNGERDGNEKNAMQQQYQQSYNNLNVNFPSNFDYEKNNFMYYLYNQTNMYQPQVYENNYQSNQSYYSFDPVYQITKKFKQKKQP